MGPGVHKESGHIGDQKINPSVPARCCPPDTLLSFESRGCKATDQQVAVKAPPKRLAASLLCIGEQVRLLVEVMVHDEHCLLDI